MWDINSENGSSALKFHYSQSDMSIIEGIDVPAYILMMKNFNNMELLNSRASMQLANGGKRIQKRPEISPQVSQ